MARGHFWLTLLSCSIAERQVILLAVADNACFIISSVEVVNGGETMRLRFNQQVPTKYLIFLLANALCAFALNASSPAAYASGQQAQSREITSEDFTRNRPPDKRLKSDSASSNKRQSNGNRTKRPIYHSVSQTTTRIPPDLVSEQIGITIWRLRDSNISDGGPKIPVHEEGGSTLWTPERARAETSFKVGDRVRLSIESPHAGYLYVIDREQYADGTLGEPSLIFPTLLARGGDNRVSAGILVEIPSQDDAIPYFNLTRRRDDLIGDLLTILVTPQPIQGITITKKQFKVPTDEMTQWEKMWGTKAELFEMEGGVGAAWTKAEQQAGAVRGRSLTQDEPTPQTIYRVQIKPGNPLLVTVPLRYGRAETRD